MKLFTKVIYRVALIASVCFTLGGSAQTNSPGAETYLPKAGVTDAAYVQIEPDPAFDDYGRRIRAAREKNPEWFREYARQHPYVASVPAPYHENFGVSKEEYEHFSQAMNQYLEVKRTEIKIRRTNQSGRVQVDFLGDDLLLTQVVLNLEDGTLKTPTDVLPKGVFIDLETATLPPGRHRGIYSRTPDAKIISSSRRESLVIGEVKDKNLGIIHYSVNTPGKVKMISIQFPK